MTQRSVLFIGGTGVISSACVDLAQRRGWEVSVLNRGSSTRHPLPAGVESLLADARDPASVTDALGTREFDVVADFVAFTPDQVRADIDRFEGRTGQYVFISSASAYQTPPQTLPVVESATLRNPFWAYSREKIACENVLVDAWRERAFPATIVRPSHTYDRTMLPFDGGYTAFKRLLDGRPIIVHGDGTSLWTLTHNTDFAKGFVGLLGQPAALGEAYHVTSDEWLTWDAITHMVAAAAGVEPRIVHVPSDAVAALDAGWGASLLGDKAHSMVFDNSKVRRLVPDFTCTVPFAQGAREVADFHLAHPGEVNPVIDSVIDTLVGRFG